MTSPVIVNALRDEIGFDPEVVGVRSLEIALRARRSALGLSDAQAYVRKFSASPAERQALIEELVVPETWFFREPAAFSLIARHALSCRDRGDETFRVASLACATGEEPYSVAMTLLEAGLEEFHVDALDISEAALSRARRAVFGRRAERGRSVPAQFRIDLGAGRFELVPAVRQRVSFHAGNVSMPVLPAGDAGYHAVFCRNVFIYLTPRARMRSMQEVARLLRPGGILFTGSAEDPRPVFRRWQSVGPPEAFAYSLAPTGDLNGASSVTPIPSLLQSVRAGFSDLSRSPRAEASALPGDTRERQSEDGLPPLPAPEEPGESIEGVLGLEEIRNLADRGLLEDALAACDRRLAVEGPEAPVYFLRAVILGAMGNAEGAEADFLRTLCLDEEHEGALTHLALLAERRGDLPRAAGFQRRARTLGRGAA